MGFIFYKFAYLDPTTCLLYWIYAITYYVISRPKQSDDCTLQIPFRPTTCYQYKASSLKNRETT